MEPGLKPGSNKFFKSSLNGLWILVMPRSLLQKVDRCQVISDDARQNAHQQLISKSTWRAKIDEKCVQLQFV